MSTIAIIPARGGSKGILRKNVRLLAGRPLIAHVIEQARQVNHVNRIVVSTDDPEIAEVSLIYGAEIVWRPDEISGDMASSESALLHTLEYMREKKSYVPDLLVFLQCTSPLTLAEDIDGTVQALVDQDADTALAVTPFHYFLWQTHAHGDAIGINHDKSVRLLRQQREPQYRETGAVYVMRTQGFLQAKHRFFGKTALYVMPPERCHEIDDPVDYEIAEALMHKREQERKLQALPDRVAGLVLDFDGVMTDNAVYLDETGKESVRCDRGDGMGTDMLRKANVQLLILSKERNPVVTARAAKLQIPVLQAEENKAEALHRWAETNNVRLETVVYVGNDINDLECMNAVGCAVAVADAHKKVIQAADIILSRPGGKGAVRELAELILARHQPV